MAYVLLTESHLTNIANAIRTKRNVSDTYYPEEMAGAINGIATLTASVSGETLVLTGSAVSVSNGTATVVNN